MRLPRWIIGLTLAMLPMFVVLLRGDVPLGVPGEWTWNRVPEVAFLAVGPVVLLGGLSVWFVAWGARRADDGGSSGAMLRLAGLCALGFAWLLAVQCLPTTPYGLSKSSHVLYLPQSSGYFSEARYGGWSTSEFLAGYEDRMAEGDVLHVGTHPPGLFLMNKSVLGVYESLPTLAAMVAATRPSGVRRVDDELLPMVRSGEPLRTADVATLWTVTLLTHGVVLFTCVPLFLLVRRTAGPTAGWWAASLWPAVPAVAVFLPKSDALYPAFGMLLVWLWLEAVERGSWWRAAAAAGVAWCGLCTSLALLPVGLLAVVVSATETLTSHESGRWRRYAWATGVALAVFLTATLLTWLATGADLFTIWAWNLHNHAAFYDVYPRTYGKWLLLNPVEVLFAAGAPLTALAVLGVQRAVVSAPAAESPVAESPVAESSEAGREPLEAAADRLRRARIAVMSLVLVWGLLWLSGKNMGEAGRLWLVLLPWLAWMAFAVPRSDLRGDAEHRTLTVLLGLQCLACAVTVASVNAFALTG